MNAQPTLTNVEAQRVLAVVDELCLDVKTSFLLPPKGLEDHPHIEDVIPEHLRGYVQHQARLEAKMKELTPLLREPVSEFIADKEQPDRTAAEDAIVQQFIQVARALRRNTRDLCRIMRQEPQVAAIVQSVLGDSYAKTALATKFDETIAQLRVQTLRSLATSVEEEKAEREHFEVVAQREKKLAQEAKSVHKDLMAVKHERNKSVSVKDDQIAQIKNELKELKALTARAAASGGRRSEQNEAAVRAFGETRANLLREVKKREAELERIKLENKEKEDAVAKRSFKKETDVESWITRYDQEMSDLNTEILTMREAYEDERARLRMVEDYFDRLRLEEGGKKYLECCQISTEAEEIARRNRLDVNAVRIQSTIRGHLMRKDLENKAKKKGKKGKGKGKGKKK